MKMNDDSKSGPNVETPGKIHSMDHRMPILSFEIISTHIEISPMKVMCIQQSKLEPKVRLMQESKMI
jgi:hypothetical protein